LDRALRQRLGERGGRVARQVGRGKLGPKHRRARYRHLVIRGELDEITVIREGEGAEVLLVHGGASPATTWPGLRSLGDRWTLAIVHRRGFPPSPPPPGGRQDFDRDAADLMPLLDRRPHVVAHSYGALGALIAAARRPAQVRSLTLIEPPLF